MLPNKTTEQQRYANEDTLTTAGLLTYLQNDNGYGASFIQPQNTLQFLLQS